MPPEGSIGLGARVVARRGKDPEGQGGPDLGPAGLAPLPGQLPLFPDPDPEPAAGDRAMIPATALVDPRLHHADLVVLAALSILAPDGACRATDEQVADRTVNISAKAVARALERLGACGYVAVADGSQGRRFLALPWLVMPS